MKLFNLTLSAITFMVTAFFLFADFPDLTTFNGIIYITMLLVLMLICVTGIFFNLPVIHKRKHRQHQHNHHHHGLS